MGKRMMRRIVPGILSLVLMLSGMGTRARAELPSLQETDLEVYTTSLARELAGENRQTAVDLDQPSQQREGMVRVMVEFNTQPNQLATLQSGISTKSGIQREQSSFYRAAARGGIKYQMIYSFQELFNGASLMVSEKDIPKIRSMAGVKAVSPVMTYERPEPMMIKSVGKVTAPYAWDLGYKGDGLTVAIIDSGFDTSHPDFKLTDSSLAEWNQAKVVAKGLKGSYINAKFPYGWNYFDQTNDLYEEGSSHGQHVAGSVGANGKIRGVAPEAQLLAMRVFSDNKNIKTTSEDIYIKAMEDALILGADVLNLSFGAPAGFSYFTQRPIEVAIANANAAGAVVAISAGNDRNMVFGQGSKASSWMPDQGLVSSPAVEKNSFSVAAADTQNATPSMAYFSSWGSTNDLRLKPEITAPGLLINSTQNDGTYNWMSGTSMATPHVAGGTAVIQDYILSTLVYSPEAKMDLALTAKNLLMNSAKMMNEGGVPISPRLQGAGMMDLERAVKARTLAVAKATGEAKVELQSISKPSFQLKLNLTNHGSLLRDYTTRVILLTDEIDGTGHYTEQSRLVPYVMTGDMSFRLEGEASKDVSLTIDFSKADLPVDQFIEGFVVFKDQLGAEISLPFMGFYGDWQRPEILDRFMVGETGTVDPKGASFFNSSGLMGYASDKDEFYQLNNDRLELNPGTPISKLTGRGSVYPVLSYLRSLEALEFNILDEQGRQLHHIGVANNVYKMNRLSGGMPSAFYEKAGTWDGKIGSERITEGLYFYEIAGRLNNNRVKAQFKRTPMIIDYSGPNLTEVRLEGNQLFVKATDGLPNRTVGIREIRVSSGMDTTDTTIILTSGDGVEFSADVSKLLALGGKNLYVFAFDNLYNSTSRVFPLVDTAPKVTRIAGETRYQTAVAISGKTVTRADTVIMVSGEAPADSLAAGPLSAQLSAPILMVDPKTGVPGNVKAEIQRLGAVRAIIVGGEVVVPPLIADELKSMGLSIQRLGGVSRYETSILVDHQIRTLSGNVGPAIIANGQTLVDALAMAPVAGGMGVGILFNDGKDIVKIKEALKGRDQIFLLGGLSVQNANVAAQIRNLGIEAERISGLNRRATAVAVAKRFYEVPDGIILANDQIPYDALAGTLLSHKTHSPILLTPADQMGQETVDYISSESIQSALILGGPLRISNTLEQNLELLLN